MLSSLESSLNRGFLSSCKIVRGQCCAQFQSVRNYPRKPRWIPIAKSKMFKTVDYPPPPKMEQEERDAQFDSYRLYTRSLWEFQGNIAKEQAVQQQKEARQVSEEVELERIFTINDAENEKVRKRREAALIEEWKEVETQILEMKREKEEEELAELEKTEKQLHEEMERLKCAIKEEDLDQVIEKALAVEYDYNYAISKDGKYFRGRLNSVESIDGPPPDEPIVKSVEASK